MSEQRVYTYPGGEAFRLWVPTGVSFLMGVGISFIDAPLMDRLLAIAFCWTFTVYGCLLERARRRLPTRIATRDDGITAVWNHGKTSTIPWGEVSRVVVERQPYRDDLKKVVIIGRLGSADIVFTHRISDYKELFQSIRQNAAHAEFEKVFLWRHKKIQER